VKLKNNFFFFLSIIFVLILLSCENQNEKSKTAPENLGVDSLYAQKIEKINNEIHSLMMDGDYESLLKFYTDNVIIVPVFEPVLRGKSALREQYIKQKKEGVVFHSFDAKTEKMWSSGNKVYEYGSYGLSGSTRNHPEPVARRGNFFTIWDKQNDGSYLTSYVMINVDHNPCK
jgi:ketosteroid isomerase-like protein